MLVSVATLMLLAGFAVPVASAAARPGQGCVLGTRHYACLWSEPGYQGRLLALPYRKPRAVLGKAFRAQSIQLAPGATVFGVGDRLSNAFARAGAEPLREPNWDPFETDAVGVRVDLVMRAPDSDNAEAATSWRRPPDRTCRLGTVHAVCLWSKPNYRGDLVTMPIGSDRLVIHRAGFAARSLQAHGDVNLWGYVGNDPYQVIGMSLGGDGSSGVSEPDLDALLPDGFSRTEVVNFWPLSSTT